MAQAESARRSRTLSIELERLKAEIQESETASLSSGKRAERLRTYFAELQRLDSERKVTLDRYSAALKNSEKALKELKKFYDNNNTMILAGLRGKKAEVDHNVNEFDAELKRKEKDVNALKQKSEIAKRGYELAKVVHDDRLKKYRELLNHQQILEVTLKEAASLKQQIEKEENVAKKYFLNEELERTLQRAKIKALARLSDDLDKAWQAVKSAKEDLDENENGFNEADAKAKSSESQLEALKKNRRAEILNRL